MYKIDWANISKLELTYCVKHNQHAKHAKARGSGSMPPSPRKILKNRCSEIESEGNFSRNYINYFTTGCAIPAAFQVHHFVLLVCIVASC